MEQTTMAISGLAGDLTTSIFNSRLRLGMTAPTGEKLEEMVGRGEAAPNHFLPNHKKNAHRHVDRRETSPAKPLITIN